MATSSLASQALPYAENKYGGNPNEPFSSIARMLVGLMEAGKLDAEMVEALSSHTENGISTIAGNIVSLSLAVAGAVGNEAFDADDASSAAYGIAGLPDLLNGFTILRNNLPEVRMVYCE